MGLVPVALGKIKEIILTPFLILFCCVALECNENTRAEKPSSLESLNLRSTDKFLSAEFVHNFCTLLTMDGWGVFWAEKAVPKVQVLNPKCPKCLLLLRRFALRCPADKSTTKNSRLSKKNPKQSEGASNTRNPNKSSSSGALDPDVTFLAYVLGVIHHEVEQAKAQQALGKKKNRLTESELKTFLTLILAAYQESNERGKVYFSSLDAFISWPCNELLQLVRD